MSIDYVATARRGLAVKANTASETMTLETITPEAAGVMLNGNRDNRPLAAQRVASLAREIAEGRWRSNGDAIRISADGRLLDGQHRLAACVRVGKPIETWVCRGLSEDVFCTIDQGAKRTIADVLHGCGVANGRTIGAAVRWIDVLRNDSLVVGDHGPGARRTFVSPEEIVRFVEENGSICQISTAVCSLTEKHVSILPPSLAVALWFLFSERGDAEFVESFFYRLYSGDGVGASDPEFVARAKLVKSMASAAKLAATAKADIVIRCWNAVQRGRPMGAVRVVIGSRIAKIV